MEQSHYRQPYFAERLFFWMIARFRENLSPLLSGMIAGFLAHGFALTNKLPSYDDVWSTFDKGTTVTSGRWMLEWTDLLFPNQSMPWIFGLLALMILTVSACVMLRTLGVRSNLLQALFAGSVTVFPSLTANMLYMFTLPPYALSFLLAVTAVWCVRNCSVRGSLLGAGLMILSLGIYQSYISIAASLLVLLLIRQLLLENAPLEALKKGFWYLGFLIVSLGAYYLLTQLINRLLDVQFNDYASMRIQFSISYIPEGIYQAYRNFFLIFRDNQFALIPTAFSKLLHVLCLLACGLLLALWFWVQKKKGQWLRFSLLAVMLLLFPLAINCLYLFVNADPASFTVHTLVLYSFIMVYLFAVALMEACDIPALFQGKVLPALNHAAVNILAFGMALVIVCNLYVANGTYLSIYFRLQNAETFFSTLLAEVKMTPGFEDDTVIALCGEYEEPDFYWDHFPYTYYMIGADGFQPKRSARTYFMEYYLGTELNFMAREDCKQFTALAEYAQMPAYPDYGSVQFFGDVLVVKMS